MRVIERKMNEAITASKDWRMSNTEVITEDNISTVYLYNRKIAEVGDTWLRVFDGGFRSNTTKSRLNAILRVHGNGEGVYQKDWQWYISTAEGDKEFESGLLLN